MVQLKYFTPLAISTILSSMTSLVSAGGMIGQVASATDFCLFLPPPGLVNVVLSDYEWNSEAYCMGSTPKATNANKLADGFILSSHYVVTDEYVQVTGQIDPAKAGLIPTDDGGQCDIAAPKGSSCDGWQYYVNLIEPANNIFCMRCCNDQVNCNRGISQKGCGRIVPGDYSGPLTGGAGISGGSSSNSSSGAFSTDTTPPTTTTAAVTSSSSSLPNNSTPTPKNNDPLGSAVKSLSNQSQPTVKAQSQNNSTTLQYNTLMIGVLLFIVMFFTI
ncbi:unnamed protein product [Cunninghamella blakesleeana]